MKVGAENKGKTWIAIGLMVVAVLYSVWQLGIFSSAPTQVATSQAQQSTPQPKRTRVTGRRGAKTPMLTPTLDPRLRLSLLQEAETTEYAGSGRNIFRAEAEPAPIPEPVRSPIADNTPKTPPAPPPPPPIPLRFFGFASRAGEPKRVFLADGEDVFVAKEGDIIDRHYRVNKIGVNSVEIQDVLTNNVQTIGMAQS